MPRQAPYLQRRGDTFFFRIAVPADLRSHVGLREITKTLCTTEKTRATPMALECAAHVMRVFGELRACMGEGDGDKLMALVREKRHKLQLDVLHDQHQDELSDQRAQHLRDLKQAKLEAENDAMRRVLAGFQSLSATALAPVHENALAAQETMSAPMLSVVVGGFLDDYRKRNKPAMLKKHEPVLDMLLTVVGDKPVSQLRQVDLNGFFDLLDKLPPRWKDACRQKCLSVRQLSEIEHDETIGPKTFKDTYIASIRPFLKAAKKNWQDQGFPLGLTTEGIEYLGDREEDENKQRAFKPNELKRLFEGREMQAFAADESKSHCYWLPHIGLFTGARVNEICQINPQADILHDDESGGWYFWITIETESDARIRKSVKTGDSRKVPIHKKLIELGFLKYFERVRNAGHKLLFPAWQPVNQRASGEAEKWFRQFLRDTKLRDETPKAKILGMHAFRHTLLTYGAMQKPPLSLFCITGHAQDETPIHAKGAGKGYLTLSLLSPLADRKELLDCLNYGLSFHKPC